jgi:hypothetical protein
MQPLQIVTCNNSQFAVQRFTQKPVEKPERIRVSDYPKAVIPAQAGIQLGPGLKLDPRRRGGDDEVNGLDF